MAFNVVTPVKLGQSAIGTVLSTLYTCPVNTRTFVKDLDICNTGAAPINVTVYLVPALGSAGAANTLVPGVMLSPNGMFQWGGNQIMNAGDTIQTIASALGCTINAGGGEAV